MIDKGLATTLITDAGLIATSYFTGQQIAPGTYIPLITIAIAILFVALDIKYPRYMAKLQEALDLLEEAEEQAAQATIAPEEPQ